MIYRRAAALRRRVRRILTARVILPGARLKRHRLRTTTFIGVTGSVGKTTTKRLIQAVVGTRGGVTVSKGTWNQRSGVAYALLRTRARDRSCVVEVGAGGRRPFGELLELLQPQVGVVLNVGSDHLSLYQGPEGVAREKAALVRSLPPSGVAVLNVDDPLVRAMAEETTARVIFFGLSEDAEVRGIDVQSGWPGRLSFRVVYGDEQLGVTTQLLGPHFVYAALAALATGIATGVSLAAGVAALAEVEPEPHRMSEVRLSSGVTFIQDDWKAPVWTLEPTLEFLGSARAHRRIAVLGQLSDDRRKPRRLYAEVARLARAHADVVVLVGEWAHHGERGRATPEDRSIVAFATVRGAHDFLEGMLEPGDLVLVKGVAFVDHLERLVLARSKSVKCWRTRCGRQLFCESCSLLNLPGAATAAPLPPR